MEDQTTLIEVLFEKTSQYTKNSVELYKLKAIGKSADIISGLATRFVLVTFITIFFVIANIGLALWIGEVLGKNYYGFFSVAGFYALLGLIFYVFRNTWIKEPVRNTIIYEALN